MFIRFYARQRVLVTQFRLIQIVILHVLMHNVISNHLYEA